MPPDLIRARSPRPGPLLRLPEAISHLRSPDSGSLGQAIRFLSVGGLVFLIYVGVTTVLANVVGVPFQVALAIGFVVGLATHFSLQRLFVWVHHTEFVLPFRVQATRYLLVAGVQYATTALVTATVPGLLHVSPTLVYIPWVVCLSTTNFMLFRHRIFHAESSDTPDPLGSP